MNIIQEPTDQILSDLDPLSRSLDVKGQYLFFVINSMQNFIGSHN